MGTLRVSYYGGVEKTVAGSPLKVEKLTTSASHAETGSFPTNAEIAIFWTDTNSVICIGTAPVAADDSTAGQFFLAANTERPIKIHSGNVAAQRKASVITV
jgi:hypothetical protein